jgi:hypothetical protein
MISVRRLCGKEDLKVFKSCFAAGLLMVTSAAMGSTSVSGEILADLSRCDSRFFSTLVAHANELSSNPAFIIAGPIGRFQVADRYDLKQSVVRFVPPQILGSLESVGYFDEIWSISDHGMMISWGFLLRASVDQVFQATQARIWDRDRLEHPEAVYARSELWVQAQSTLGWQKVVTANDQPPRPGTVERVLLIEPYEADASLTRFGCSLQGDVTREMLREHRPDLFQ